MGRNATTAWALKYSICAVCLSPVLVPFAARGDELPLRLTERLDSAFDTSDPVAWLMAQAAAPAGASPPERAPAPAMQASTGSLLKLFANDSGGPLQLAPIRWRGNATYEFRDTRLGEGGRRALHTEVVNFEVSSFIMQPWLAQVRANLGLALYQERSRDEDLGSGELSPERSQRSGSVSGGGTLMLFPASRFPFTASVLSTDSRSSGDIASTDTVTRLLTLRQTYRTPLGDQVYTGSFDRSVLISDAFGRDTLTALNGSWLRTLDSHLFDVNGAWSQNRRPQDGQDTDLARISGRHSWHPDDRLVSLESYASLSMAGLGGGDSKTRFSQLSSFGTWRPEEESPLFVTGGVRFSDSSIAFQGAQSTAQAVGGNVAASYAVSPALRLIASSTVTALRNDGAATTVATESLGASYSPAAIAIGPLNYSWAASGSQNAQVGGVQRQHALVGQANHQVSAGAALGSVVSVNGTISQGFTVNDESERGLSRTLTHSASVGTRWTPTPGSDGYLSVGAGDSRTRGARQETFRMFNLQASGNIQLGNYTYIAANFTLQAIRQRHRIDDPALDEFGVPLPLLPGEDEERNHSVQRYGTLSFQQARVFNVRNLRFTASATYTDASVESRALGDVNAPANPYNRIYEARLQYDIGRLGFALGTRFAKLEGREDRQIFFRVNRQFGIY